MTRMFRAIPLSCVRLSAISAFAATALLCTPVPASASIFDFLAQHKTGDAQPSADAPDDAVPTDSALGEMPDVAPTPKPVADVEPSIETPLHHLYCVEYARVRSGLQIFGDAKTWWASARNIYNEFTAPVADAVMVFSGSSRIRRGHVAVVTAVVSPREIRVDQANWQNHGEIDHNTPVLDVSSDNDWSKVRVWDVATRQFGTHVYKISGFIARAAAAATTGS